MIAVFYQKFSRTQSLMLTRLFEAVGLASLSAYWTYKFAGNKNYADCFDAPQPEGGPDDLAGWDDLKMLRIVNEPDIVPTVSRHTSSYTHAPVRGSRHHPKLFSHSTFCNAVRTGLQCKPAIVAVQR